MNLGLITSERWYIDDPRCNRGLMELLETQSPEGGDTIFCIAPFGALGPYIHLIPRALPGVIIVRPSLGLLVVTIQIVTKTALK